LIVRTGARERMDSEAVSRPPMPRFLPAHFQSRIQRLQPLPQWLRVEGRLHFKCRPVPRTKCADGKYFPAKKTDYERRRTALHIFKSPWKPHKHCISRRRPFPEKVPKNPVAHPLLSVAAS
jgi:hypothetical protein